MPLTASLRRPGFRPLPAALCHLSASGAAVLLDHPLRPGTLVELVLPGGLPERHHTFAARVTDAIRSSGGGWLVECAFFTPLGEPQVVLLRPAAAHT